MNTSNAKRLLTAHQVAQLLRVSEGTLANWRSRGTGPLHGKLRTRVRYLESDVRAYLAAIKARQNIFQHRRDNDEPQLTQLAKNPPPATDCA